MSESNTRAETIQIMAREAKAVLGEMLNAKPLPPPVNKSDDWSATGQGQSIDLIEAAERFLARLEASGRAVVPVEPTQAMIDAGLGLVTRGDIWSAMLAAAPSTFQGVNR